MARMVQKSSESVWSVGRFLVPSKKTIGCARVSSNDQNLNAQHDALAHVGVGAFSLKLPAVQEGFVAHLGEGFTV